MRKTLPIAIGLIALSAVSAGAQGRGRNTNGVPPGQRPPDGMCRVWVDGVPPGQQQAPTDCATARLNVPANGRIIYGGHPGRGKTARDTRGLTDRDDNLLTRRRQLPNGSWVSERYRKDANGNIVVVSTKPWKGNSKDAWKRDHKNDKKEWKDEKKEDKREMKAEKKELKASVKTDDERGEKGKGKGKNK
jgi:hypothetical protein